MFVVQPTISPSQLLVLMESIAWSGRLSRILSNRIPDGDIATQLPKMIDIPVSILRYMYNTIVEKE